MHATAVQFETEAASAKFKTLAARIDCLIAKIDQALNAQVNAILHTPEFMALSARWLALQKLVFENGNDGEVLIKLLDVDWKTLSRNLERSVDFDQSHLHKLVYEDELGMPGGLPYGLLIGDYDIGIKVNKERGDSIDILRRIASVAAAAFCPFIATAAPDCFGLDSYQDLSNAPDLGDGDSAAERIRWDALREQDDTRFIGLVAPRILIRKPYRLNDPDRIDQFPFCEIPGVLTYASGAFAFATTVIETYKSSGWFAAIRGAYQDETGGGRITLFDGHDFGTDKHGMSEQPPVEVRLTSFQEQYMVENGIVPISSLYMVSDPVFNACPSFHRPGRYSTAIAVRNARLASMLQYVLCAARFAHFLKVIMRDEIGSIADENGLQSRLHSWLMKYCISNEDADTTLTARYPLRSAGVKVAAIAGRPGVYSCAIHLQPHFQLDDIATTFHLVADSNDRQRIPQRTA
ncbi:type VI secretion system contractile sheath large subunit [Parasulfitobacter algicola]|uniref:Type VI secretion system contractile sheath large subunit n=1 Tax=Parasulfitobacter algicola TaxID=2614809 RepID=A0ABX2IN14_9RHOB|nr:type VI secretion system contractile sheath large subunit [Sulfitobacter algicola]NSX53735.1 type VI secretion system contractile sheath large subunit [Sulfitobacter algicola]